MWFECHQPRKTKPCIAIMTARAVECPWCRPEYPIVQRGYVPLYRQSDWAPRCVIVSDLYRDTVDKFALHDRVMIGKEGEATDPVWIMRALEARPVFNTTLRHRYDPVDLTESLLRIWGNADLAKWWVTVGSKASDNAVSLPKGTAVNDKGTPVSPMLQGAAKRAGFDVVPAAPLDVEEQAAADYLRAVQAGRNPTSNGNGRHKPPKKG